MNLWQFAARGGILMVPIIACGILAIAIIIERILFLRRSEIDSEQFLQNVEKLLQARKIKEALNNCETSHGPIPQIVRTALLKSDRSIEEIKDSIHSEASYQVLYLEKYLGILATIATIAPLLGFLGTVTGLIKAFIGIEEKGGIVYSGMLARGIWESLVATLGGLVVAIPAYLGFNYLVARVNRIIADMERSASRLMDILVYMREEEDI
jgi:biopolymer transport protein ExbB